jgi:hypothetical protein
VRPELSVVPGLLSALVLFSLLVPKRGWSEIPTRVRAVATGERRYVYGPRYGGRAAGASRVRAILRGLVGEIAHLIEMGLPLFVVALATERLGHHRRAADRQRWETSSSNLIGSMLEGRLPGDDLRHRFEALRHPQLRQRQVPENGRQYEVPPISWRLDWERGLGASANGVASAEDGVELTPTPGDPVLSIQALGPLHIRYGDRDLAPDLLHRRVIGFTWLYLLARAVLKAPITREAMADEGAPGLDPEARNVVLRNRLSRLRSDEDLRPLGALIVAEGAYLRVDVSDCTFDVMELLSLADEMASAGPMLTEAMEVKIEDLLATHSGEFLPAWDDLEAVANGGRGAAGDMIREVRLRVEDARGALLVSLGDSALARQRPDQALVYFERAIEQHPDREDVAQKLVEACGRCGQDGYARRVRLRYGLPDPAA